MPISRQTLSETLSDDLASLHKARAALSNAWALRMSASLKAHFAAVMGNSLTRNCREQGWSVEEALRDDGTMTAAMRTYAIDEDPLYSAMAEHVRWILMKIEEGIVADIRATDPDFDVSSDSLQQGRDVGYHTRSHTHWPRYRSCLISALAATTE